MSRGGNVFVALAQSVLVSLLGAAVATGHSGPPFPIVSDRVVGAYNISVWTDPDTTDDRTPGGKFWVIAHSADGSDPAPATRVVVVARPLDRPGPEQRTAAASQQGGSSRYFANLVLDHEGKWQIDVLVDGPGGAASTSAEVDATYDLRPSVVVLPFLLLPFLLVGFLWLKALRTRGQRIRR